MSQNFGDGRHLAARKPHKCTGCLAPIPKGEIHYQYKGKYDGEWQNWRMHEECFEDYDRNYDNEESMPGDFPIPGRLLHSNGTFKAAPEPPQAFSVKGKSSPSE